MVSAWKDAVKREAGTSDLRRGSSGVSEPQLSVSLRRGSVASQDSLQGGSKEAANGVTPSSRAPVRDTIFQSSRRHRYSVEVRHAIARGQVRRLE